MYKRVIAIADYPHGTMYTFDHLLSEPKNFHMKADDQIHLGLEIVQGFGAKKKRGDLGVHFKDRPRKQGE